MKKIITGLLLVGVLAPMMAFAAGVPGSSASDECCIIRHTLDPLPGDGTTGPTKDTYIGPKTTSSCAMAGTTAVVAFPNTWGAYCAIDTVYTVTDWIFWGAFVIGGVVIIIGGIMFMFASGDPTKSKTARLWVIYGIVGIAIAALAKVIPSFARVIVGV